MPNNGLPAPGSGTLVVSNMSPSVDERVTFTGTYPGDLKNPRVTAQAYRDGQEVWVFAGGPGVTRPHADQPVVVDAILNTDGEADVVAHLQYIEGANGKEWTGSQSQSQFVTLAVVEFHVAP